MQRSISSSACASAELFASCSTNTVPIRGIFFIFFEDSVKIASALPKYEINWRASIGPIPASIEVARR